MADHESLEVMVARIDERTLNLVKAIAEMHDLLMVQNSRVSSLERWRAYLTGAITIVAAALTFALSIIAGKL